MVLICYALTIYCTLHFLKGWPVVILDVDSKQSESALRGPPPSFVTQDFLKALSSIVHPKGMHHNTLC